MTPEGDRSSSSLLGAALIQEPWSVPCLSCTASSYALWSFGFLCTWKTFLLVYRKQNSCVLSDNASSPASGLRAVISFCKWSSQFALRLFLSCFADCLLLLGVGNNPSISNWSTLNVAFPFNFLPHQGGVSRYPSLTAEVLSLCRVPLIFGPGAEEWLSFTTVHVLTAQKATNTYCLCWSRF